MYVFYFIHTDEPGKYYNWVQEKNQRMDTFINQEYLHEYTNGGKTSFFNSGEERSIQPLPDRTEYVWLQTEIILLCFTEL